MKIRDYIRDEVFGKRAADSGCLVVYDPARRYRDLALGLAGPRCQVLDATVSVIEQREVAMDGAPGRSPRASLDRMVVWCPSPAPPNRRAAAGGPVQRALARRRTVSGW